MCVQQPSIDGRVSADGAFAVDGGKDGGEEEGERDNHDRRTRMRRLDGEVEEEGEGEGGGGEEEHETSVHMRMVSVPRHDDW